MRKDAIAVIIEDLMTIAKVAMPPDLFEQDPRIKKAKALLVGLGREGPVGRPPNTGLDDELEKLIGPIVDLGPVDASAMVLEWDLVDGVLEAREDGLVPPDDNALLNSIVRDWLMTHGYLKPSPEELS
ncbi:MAG: hypothetical protein ABL962_08040 [Fimbriimonadaceae bacterium]